MEVLKNVWVKVTLALSAILVVVLYFLNLKKKKINELEAQLDLIDTQKKADVLETEINKKLDQVEMNKKEVEQHKKVLVSLEEKRKELKQKQNNMTPEEIEKYWNK